MPKTNAPDKQASDIKDRREALNWSQEKLAKEADLSYRTVWAAEQGLKVQPKSLRRILEALDAAEAPAA